MKWRWLGYGLIATPILALTALLVVAIWGVAHAFRPEPVRDFADVTKWTQVQFPANARVIDGEFRGPGTLVLIVKAEMPRSHVRAFLAQPTLKKAKTQHNKLVEDYGAIGVMKEFKGWVPGKPKHFISLGSIYDPAGQLWMLLDLDNPKTAMLYLYYSD